MAKCISFRVGGSHCIGRSVSADCMFCGSTGLGLFRSSSQCSAHLFSCFSASISFPRCILRVFQGVLVSLHVFFCGIVELFIFLLAAAASACSVSPSK